jgi:hypothetical protein
MYSSWNGDTKADPASIARAYLVHPNDAHWMNDDVKEWANTNPKNIKRGESKTEWEALEKAHGKEVRDQIYKAKENSQKFWNYTNKHYETFFDTLNKVKNEL